ncbi:MAG: sigma-70 family RNA polymerase sigma factor [Elusimicrobiota bacterium]|nr:sigma-70 family RNA polymerase sigma factor [Elusimicrobiota bacterium]
MDARTRGLIEKARNGDAAAFDALIRGYQDPIYRMARHVCAAAPGEVDDVFQDTFLTAFKKLKQFRGDADLKTWLYRIASNLCLMRYRKKAARPEVPMLDRPDDDGNLVPADFPETAPAPEEAARRRELTDAVASSLAELPVDYRLVLTLRDVEGLSAEETAKILKLSVPAVKSRLHRGRLFLRDRFQARFAEEAA